MSLLGLIILVLAAFGIWYLITVLSRPNPLDRFSMESYGGNQSECEDLCYSSKYYDACMNVCMTGSSAGWTGRPDSYTLPAIEAPVPLDEETGQEYVTVEGPYRYDYPGH